MKKINYAFIILFTIFIISFEKNIFSDTLLIDDFNNEKNFQFPSLWQPQNEKGNDIYKISEENNNKFLRAVSKNDSINIGHEFDWDIKKYPFISWRWRIKELPKGADIKVSDKHDCPAVYVLIKNSFSLLPKYIKYVWTDSEKSSTKFFFKKNRAIVVLRDKQDNLNEWYLEKRNVYEDYKFFYGEKEPVILGISILTDSNDTKTQSTSDYDDIFISNS